MRFEIGSAAPIFIEHEGIQVFCVDMKIVVQAPRLGPGWRDWRGEDRPQLFSFFRPGDNHADYGAMAHDSDSWRECGYFREGLRATARMMMMPRAISCWLYSNPISNNPLLMSPIIKAPTIEPITLPAPPNKLVPPRTAAAMTESSSPSPSWKRP